MSRFKKFCALFTALCLSTNVLITSYAYEILGKTELDKTKETAAVFNANMYNSTIDAESMNNILDSDLSGFEEYLIEQFAACNEFIDISKYKIEVNDENFLALGNYIFDEIEESFHFATMDIYDNNIYYTKIAPKYIYNAEEYKAMIAECERVADGMISDILDNESLSDAEKALLLHDRLANNCTYDYSAASESNPEDMAFVIYGALVEG